MTEQDALTMAITNFPNFAGFSVAIFLMYRLLMAQIKANQDTHEMLRSCLRDMLTNHEKGPSQ